MAGLHFDITGDNSNLIRKLQETEQGVRNVSKTVEREGGNIEELFGRLTKAVAAFGVGLSAKEFISQSVQIFGEFQKLEVAFTTMLGSTEKADALMQQMVRTAATTPFDLQGVTNGAKSLLAYGVAAEDINSTLIRLGDIAAGLSIPLGDIVYLYGTTMVQGRLYTADLNQFTGRGIPMLQELAKQFGVAESEVKSLVEAGKVGFPEVQKVIESLTNEGGKFGGLMEAQSKITAGKISNIEDSISQMFNNIGKANEGVINGTLDVVSDLVENYEAVGKTILELVVTYGAYKAVLITITALQKAHSVVLAQAVVEQRLAAAAGITLSNAQAMVAARTKLLQVATASLNKTMMLNPYVLVASAVAALGFGFYKLVTYQTEAEKAQAKLKETEDEYEKSLASEQLQLDRLFTKLRTAKEGTEEYNKAKQTIISQYGSYLDGMSAEIRTLQDVEGAYRAVNDAIIDAAKARAMEKATKDAADDYVEKEAEARERLRKALESKYGNHKDKEGNLLVDKYEAQLLGTLDGKTRVNQEFLKKFDKVYVNTRGTAGNAETSTINPITGALFDIQKAKQVYDDIVKQAEGKFATTSKLGTTGTDDTKKVFSDIAKETANAIEKVRTLKQELADLRSGKTIVDGKSAKAAIEEKEKELKDAENILATLTGRTGGGSSRAATEEEQKQKEIAEAALKAQEDAVAARLALERSYIKDKVKLLEFDKEQELKAIDERIKAARSAEEKASLEDLKATTTKKYDTQIADETKSQADDRLKQQEADWDEAIMKFGTYQQKKFAIERKYDKEIADAQNAGQEWAAIEAKKAALQSLDEQYGKSTQAMADLFEDAGEKSVGEIQKIIDKYELLIKFLSGTEQPDGTAVSTDELKAVGFTDKDIEKIQRGEISIKDVTDAVKGLKGELSGKSPWQAFVSDMEKAIDKLKSADGDSKKVGQGIMDIGNAVTSFAPAVGEFANNIASMFGAEDTNITEITNAIGGLGQTAAGIGQIMSGDIIGGTMAAVGGISQVVGAIKQIHDKKNERQIEKLQDQIEALDKSYDKLGRDVEKAYSVDASDLIEQQNQMLEQQKVLIQGQIAEEQAKKNSDDERIKEWQNQLDEINEQIEDNKEAAVDAIFGEDLKSAIDNFASAYAEAWANGEDRAESAKETVKNMMRQMVTESIKAAIESSKKMEEIRQKLQEFYSDNVLSSWEQDYVYNMAEELQKELDNQFGWAEDLYKDKTKEQQSASGRGFGTEMTHEDAGELSGRFTALYEVGLQILQNVTILQSIGVSADSCNSTLLDIRNLMISSNGYLEDISGFVKKILDGFSAKLDDINMNIRNGLQ